MNEKDIDVREVLTLSLRTSVYERSKDHGRIAEYVAQRIETRTRESGLPLKRLEAVKVADSDPLVYKLCSKFIHPSAFLIATLQDRLMDDTFRRMFAAFALGCAANALEHNRQATRRSA